LTVGTVNGLSGLSNLGGDITVSSRRA